MLEIDFIVGARQAESRRCFQGAAALLVKFPDQRLQTDIHGCLLRPYPGSAPSWVRPPEKTTWSASRLNSAVLSQVENPSRVRGSPSRHHGTSGALSTN